MTSSSGIRPKRGEQDNKNGARRVDRTGSGLGLSTPVLYYSVNVILNRYGNPGVHTIANME